MIAKVVVLFLVFMAVLAMFGRLRFPAASGRRGRRDNRKCPRCGRHMIGKGPCACGKGAR